MKEKKEFTVIEKWDQFGLMGTIKNDILKEKLANAMELASNLIISNNIELREYVDVMIFPMLYKMHCGSSDIILVESFVFDKDKMLDFINFVNDNLDIFSYRKYLKNIDVEATVCHNLANMYVLEQNKLIINQIKK